MADVTGRHALGMVLQEIRSDWVLGGVVGLVDTFPGAGSLHMRLPLPRHRRYGRCR
jgi:hypothetical protein